MSLASSTTAAPRTPGWRGRSPSPDPDSFLAATGRGKRPRSLTVGAHDDEGINPGLGAPDLARSAEQLADPRSLVRQGHDGEGFRVGIEADDRVRPEIGQPDIVALVDVDGVRLRGVAGQPPLRPLPGL